MTRPGNPGAPSPDPRADDDDEDGSVPADPDAPGRSLFDESDDAVEPNEPA